MTSTPRASSRFSFKRFKQDKGTSSERESSQSFYLPELELYDRVFEELDEVQEQLVQLEQEKEIEIEQADKRDYQKRKPLYVERSNIIKDINLFWLKAFLGNPVLSEYLQPADQEVFKYVTNFFVEEIYDEVEGGILGFKVIFHFSENKYFHNTTLYKEFRNNPIEGAPPIVSQSTIQWKEGMDYTNLNRKPQKRENDEDEDEDEDEEEEEEEDVSFFNFFTVKNKDRELGERLIGEFWRDPVVAFKSYVKPESVDNNENSSPQKADLVIVT